MAMPDSTASCNWNGLLDGDERADADIGQAFRRLDD